MAASDYGGGIPMANIWRRDAGLAVGHVEPIPRLLDLPGAQDDQGREHRHRGREGTQARARPGTLHRSHLPDRAHRRSLRAARPSTASFSKMKASWRRRRPESAFAPVWCAWGYEREFTVEQIVATLPKVRVARIRVGGARRRLAEQRRRLAYRQAQVPNRRREHARLRQGNPRAGPAPAIWIAPLCADPGSDVLHDHADMLLLDEWGAFQTVSWWNA